MKKMFVAALLGMGTLFSQEENCLKQEVYKRMLLCKEIAVSERYNESGFIHVYFAGMAAAYEDIYADLMGEDD